MTYMIIGGGMVWNISIIVSNPLVYKVMNNEDGTSLLVTFSFYD